MSDPTVTEATPLLSMLEFIKPWISSEAAVISILLAMLVGIVVLMPAVLLLCNMWRNTNKRLTITEQKVERLQHDLLVANKSAIGMGQQIVQLEKNKNAHKQDNQAHTSQYSKPNDSFDTQKNSLIAENSTVVSLDRKLADKKAAFHQGSDTFKQALSEHADNDLNPRIEETTPSTSDTQSNGDKTESEEDAINQIKYEQARQLLLSGIDIVTVTQRTGLSLAEVSLISALHTKKSKH